MTDAENPDQGEDCQEISDRLRQDLVDRLNWDVFGPLGDIRVKDESEMLTPFLGHQIASESLANPPLTRVEIIIECCSEKASHDENDEDDGRYKAPEPLVIEKQDDSPIILYEFVSQVHRYLNANGEELYKCEDEMYFTPTALDNG